MHLRMSIALTLLLAIGRAPTAIGEAIPATHTVSVSSLLRSQKQLRAWMADRSIDVAVVRTRVGQAQA